MTTPNKPHSPAVLTAQEEMRRIQLWNGGPNKDLVTALVRYQNAGFPPLDEYGQEAPRSEPAAPDNIITLRD